HPAGVAGARGRWLGILAPAQIAPRSPQVKPITPVETGPTRRAKTDKKSWTEKGVEDSVEGKTKDLTGKIKDAAGGLTGDSSLQAEGKIHQLKGKATEA